MFPIKAMESLIRPVGLLKEFNVCGYIVTEICIGL